MSHRAPSFHLWVPGLAETGGIQHYSHCLQQALTELFPVARVRIQSKNDAANPTPHPPRIRVQSFGHLPNPLRTWLFTLAGLAHAWRERPTACFMTHPHFAKVLSLLPFPANVPVIASSHGVEVWGHLHGRLSKGLQACRGWLPVSEFTRQVMIREGGFDPARTLVVPDTLREQVFAPGPKPGYLLRRHGIKSDQPVLLTVGRLAASEAYKGQDQVIAALPAIRQKFPDVRYVIAGTGDDEARLRRLAAEHRQTEAVIFAGFVPEPELADYYRLCDAFVMPSTGEGFGIVYLEALASGRPCIVGNRDASPEAIGHGRLGFAVDPRSPEAIATALLQLLNRNHDKPWLHEPETLRKEVIELYGFAAFERSLGSALSQLLPNLKPNNREQRTANVQL